MSIHASYSDAQQIDALYASHFQKLIETFNVIDETEILFSENHDFLCEQLNAILIERFHITMFEYEEKATRKRVYTVRIDSYIDQACDETMIMNKQTHKATIFCESSHSALALITSLASIALSFN